MNSTNVHASNFNWERLRVLLVKTEYPVPHTTDHDLLICAEASHLIRIPFTLRSQSVRWILTPKGVELLRTMRGKDRKVRLQLLKDAVLMM